MNWYWWILVGVGAACYLHGWRQSVRLIAWSSETDSLGHKDPLPDNISGWIILTCMFIALFVAPFMAVISFVSVWGHRVDESKTLKRLFPPLSENHKQMARKVGGW